ncbi:DotU family type IV/VI secretion system protein [Caballeronia sp. SEWSISQ10-4 2]|uniref:DotU family type IV/VI secretion system protein n=1 Tax=Caballeronia sp. SEWSISQ10-4 2 TaxID=2937438 RepID=UPI002652712A|nr:DotU family type IV/VI secretion system protein [Caballeronia sp. SEWSISQ10-4 2]MDN7183258.1 DotU family type IV/VI secretion system protein [Caballeronia sp. SEWSISQ10-4 2]
MHATEREGPRTRLPLYSYFCDFYAMLVDVKQALSATPTTASALQRAPELEPAAVHERLLDQLRAQYSTVQKDCTPDQCDVYRDAQYAMAALADEQLLLEIDWSGRTAWLDLMLESALFDTRIAGVRFYRMIDRLLAVPAPTQAHAELGLVLLGAIDVGFRGALRGVNEADVLTQRRQELVKFVREVRRDQPGSHAFEQAYEHTLEPTLPEPADCRLAPLSPWFNAARLALAVYLAVAAVIWFGAILPFRYRVAADTAASQERPALSAPAAMNDSSDDAGKRARRAALMTSGSHGRRASDHPTEAWGAVRVMTVSTGSVSAESNQGMSSMRPEPVSPGVGVPMNLSQGGAQ